MLAVPLVNMQGERLGEIEVDPAVLGGTVRHKLIKQAIVAYNDHQHQHTASTKGRADVAGSTRKLYRQKGTGNARAGNARTPIRRGGGHTFAKRVPPSTKVLPKKMRRLALRSALLAKIQAESVVVVDDLQYSAPETKTFAAMLSALGVQKGCLLAISEHDNNVYRSGRNIPRTDIRVVDELGAYDVLRRAKVLFARPAFERLTQGVSNAGDATARE